MTLLASGIGLVLGLVFAGGNSEQGSAQQRRDLLLVIAIGLPLLLAGAALYLARAIRRRMHDPNRDAAQRAGKPWKLAPTMTRAEHERLVAQALANHTPPPPEIAWVTGPRKTPSGIAPLG